MLDKLKGVSLEGTSSGARDFVNRLLYHVCSVPVPKEALLELDILPGISALMAPHYGFI